MAEIGVIASIIGIAGVGIKLSKTLYQCAYNNVQANHQINRVATQVTMFSTTLNHVGHTLRDAHSLHSAEAEETIKRIVQECRLVFQEITNIVVLANDRKDSRSQEKVVADGRKRRLSVVQRVKWYFEQPKVDYLLAQLEYLKTTLSVMLQTLHLAAHIARDKAARGEREKASDGIVQERLHVETLIAAQQLSVTVLDGMKDESVSEIDAPPPTYSSEQDEKHPKVLTLNSHTPLMLVKLGEGSLGFLERKNSLEDGSPLEKRESKSDDLVDELLSRWTIQPNSMALTRYTKRNSSADLEEQGMPTPAYSSVDENERSDHENSTPDLTITPVQTIQSVPGPVDILTGNGGPPFHAPQWLDPNAASHPPPPRSQPTATADDRHLAVRPPMERTHSNPESDALPILNEFHDHHGLQPGPPRTSSVISSNKRDSKEVAPMARSASPTSPLRDAANAPIPYTPQFSKHDRPSSRAGFPSHWSNYRPPTSESIASSRSSSDGSEGEYDLGPLHNAQQLPHHYRTRMNSTASRVSQAPSAQESGLSDGLEIPWRLRVSPTQYYDYRDRELIGPRTPYVPSNPESWIYNHEAARTFISKDWVCEEALMEKRFQYGEPRGEAEVAGLAGNEGAWRIWQPLRFHEVEALVNRTIEIFRQRQRSRNATTTTTTTKKAPPPRPFVQTQPQSSPRAPPPYTPYSPTNTQHRFAQPRSASFQDAALPNPWAPSLAQDHHYRPTYPPAGGPAVQGTTHPWAPNAPLPRGLAPRNWPSDGAAPRTRHERERDRDYRRDMDRSRERERAHKHGSMTGSVSGSSKAERERDRNRRVGTMAGTMTKIGALAALLEGLEGVML